MQETLRARAYNPMSGLVAGGCWTGELAGGPWRSDACGLAIGHGRGVLTASG